MLPLIFLGYFVITTSGLSLMKVGQGLLTAPYLAGLFLYGIGFLVFSGIIIKSMPLSMAFPLASAGLIIGTQLAGYLVFGESISLMQVGAITFILIGISMLATI